MVKKQAHTGIFSKDFLRSFLSEGSYATVWAEVAVIRKILEKLYHGNLSVDERTIRAGSKYARALAEVAKIEEAIYERLPEKDHALLRDYALASAQLANVSMVEDFITGFRMGAQIMMAVLLPDGQSPEQIGKASQDE